MARLPVRARKRRLWLGCAGLALAAVAVALLLWPAGPQVAPEPSAALRAAAEGLDEIAVTARYDPDARTLAVAQSLALSNRTGQALDTLVLRAYPNAFETEETSPAALDELYCYPEGFTPGKLDVRSLAVNGAPARYAYADSARTVLTVTLAEAWQPGETLRVEADYAVLVPKAAYRLGANGGIVALGNALLTPALWQNGAYRTDAYAAIGDPFVSECRNYRVTLTVPAGWRVGGTGYALPTATAEGDVYALTALAARDFALCLSPSYVTAQAREGDALVTALATSQASAELLLREGRAALRYFEGLLGAYPYPTLTLCEADFPLGGMEYPALTMLGSAQLAEGDAAQAIAHEVAHQWFYALVGSDQVNDPWQDEALCQYLLLRWAEDTRGPYLRESLEANIEAAARISLGADVTPGMPLGYYPSAAAYAVAVYERGAGLFVALERFMGKEGLTAFLRRYAETYAYGLCTRAEFEALLNASAGADLSPLLLDYLDTLP